MPTQNSPHPAKRFLNRFAERKRQERRERRGKKKGGHRRRCKKIKVKRQEEKRWRTQERLSRQDRRVRKFEEIMELE